ncbi:MAG TPA: DUF1127 domain-containing protein [Variovorax sp.]|nr:DUF1127 domain-containing protein [Variovorax sp.]
MIVLPYSFLLVRRLRAALAAWSRQRRDRAQLECMSESELRDIGIGRSQIPGLID